MLAEAKSEILKQELEVDYLNACVGYGQCKLWVWRIPNSKPDYTKKWRHEKNTSRYSYPDYSWNGRIEESSGNASWWILFAKTKRSHATTPLPSFAGRPSSMNSFFLSSDGWSAKTANLGASFRYILHTFNVFMLEDNKVQNQGVFLFRFSLGGYIVDRRRGEGRFGGWFKIIFINKGSSIPEFWDAGLENCISFEQDHPEFLLQEKGQSGGTESSERGSVSSWKTDRLHYLRLLSSHWRSWCSSWLCWLILHRSSKRWCSGNFIDYDQDPTWWYLGKSAQIENTWVWSTQHRKRTVRHGNSSEDEAWLWKVEEDGEEKYWSNFDHEILTPEMRGLRQEQCFRVAGD